MIWTDLFSAISSLKSSIITETNGEGMPTEQAFVQKTKNEGVA